MSRQDEWTRETEAAALERLRAAAGAHRQTPVVIVYTRQSVSDFDAEGRIEFAAKVFQRDRGGQFDDLRLAVMLLQPGEQRVIDPLVGDRHPLSVFERDPFGFAEQSAIAPARNRGQPFFALIAFPHTEGIDVDSERAAIDRRDAQRDQGHQAFRQQT